MLELKDVSVIFNQGTQLEKVALHDMSCKIQDGDFITLLGSNGAGKSTLFNVISGSVEVSQGTLGDCFKILNMVRQSI